MDALGIETLILSLNAPAVQAIADAAKAAEVARIANDVLAEAIAKHPRRFAGFAALPMENPEAAALELERCIHDYGFVGALVNGYSQIGDSETCVYYDAPQYRPLWALFEQLDVPFYLHPRAPSERKAYAGHPWLVGPAYGFGAETGFHALRLAGSGIFDTFPSLKIILGHLGEGSPFNLYRIDERIRWSPLGYPAKSKSQNTSQRTFTLRPPGTFARRRSLIASWNSAQTATYSRRITRSKK